MSVSSDFVSVTKNNQVIRRIDYVRQETDFKWAPENRVSCIPDWVYTKHDEPECVEQALAEICALNHTITDIDLQIEIKKANLNIQDNRPDAIDQFNTWHYKTLKAKQTTRYVLCAYNYWLCLNKKETTNNHKLDMLLELLADDPVNFTEKVLELKNR